MTGSGGGGCPGAVALGAVEEALRLSPVTVTPLLLLLMGEPIARGAHQDGGRAERTNVSCLIATRFHQILYLNCPAGPVSGSWGEWRDWSQCSQTCGGGTKTRRRLCDNPSPAFGGADCPGDHSQQRQCNSHQCEVPGKNIKPKGLRSCIKKGREVSIIF